MDQLLKERDIERRVINEPDKTIHRYVIYSPDGKEHLLGHHQDAVEAIERSGGYYSATRPPAQQKKKRRIKLQ